jgi:FkbM family methyltransferase
VGLVDAAGNGTAVDAVTQARPAVPSRVVCLRLPAPVGVRETSSRRKWLVVEAPRSCFVPKVLEQKALAGYEPDALACFLATETVAGPGAVWDVGANVGVYGLLARALTDRPVRAFEPAPDLADLARSIATANGLPYPVEQVALGASSGEATFYLSDVTDSSNSLAEGFRPSSKALNVTVETVDDVVRRTGEVPAVLKIDTETTEPDVLRGAARLIEQHRPWLLCEVLGNPRYGKAVRDVIEPWDYHWYHITDELPLQPADDILGDPEHRHLMWLFAPEPPGDEFWAACREWREGLAVCSPVVQPDRSAQLGAELRRVKQELTVTKQRLAQLKASRQLRAGQLVAKLVRHPVRSFPTVAVEAYRLWRRR